MISYSIPIDSIGLSALSATIDVLSLNSMHSIGIMGSKLSLSKLMLSKIKALDLNKDVPMPRGLYVPDITNMMPSIANSVFLDLAKIFQTGMILPTTDGALRSFLNVISELVRQQEWTQSFIEEDRRQAEAIEAFAHIGWPLAPSMPDDLRERVIDLYRQGKGSYAVQPILGYYRRREHSHLIDAVQSWNSSLLHTERMDIFCDCLEDHCRGRYTLLIPVLLLQIEGILRVYAYQTQSARVNAGIAPICAAALDDEDVLCWSDWSTAQALLHVLRENIYKGHTPFDAELRKLAHRRTATRNTIAHGVSFRYDRVAISLRLFLVLDALTILAGYLMKDAA